MIRACVIICAGLTLTGCGNNSEAVLFDGMRYSGRLQADAEDKRSFVASASPVSQGLDGAREAARYEGTRYCVRKYGRSDIDWVLGPEAEVTALAITDDTLTLQGRCAE